VYNRFSQEVEPYSIDESFLYFPDWTNADYSQIAFSIREAVSTETGIPVSIGIAPSKTLAKMCNKLSKKRNGICEWEKLDKAAELQNYPVGDIWGVGWSKTALLKSQGIMTAFDLQHYPLEKAKKYLTIVGMRTVQELNGITSIDHVHREGRQSIACSRSFSGAVFELHEITAALAEYTEEVVKRLRESKQACRRVTVYLMTKLAGDEQYSNAASAELPRASSFLPDILGTAIVLLKQIYRKGYRYRKVMIHLMGMEADSKNQLDLFEESCDRKERKQLMGAFDSINAKYGRGALHMGVHNPAKTDGFAPWEMKREFLSPEYTTRLADIPKVR
jgi:DNA polymerase V